MILKPLDGAKRLSRMIKNLHSIYQVIQSSMKMNLRPVTAADLARLRHWDEQPHVVAASPNADWGWEVELNRSSDWREQLIGELDGRPIGFV